MSLRIWAPLIAVLVALSGPAIAFDSGGGDTKTTTSAASGPTLASARADIKAKRWSSAIQTLQQIVKADQGNADAYNLLGYSYRNSGDYPAAGKAYARALAINPNHLGALEYQGVLFIKLGQRDKAAANLATLKRLCGTSCEEYKDLAEALN